MYVHRRNFCIFKEIRVEKHDDDVIFSIESRNTALSHMRNKKYAIEPLFMAELSKFPRIKGKWVEKHDGNVRF